MLILTRRIGESIYIGDDVIVQLVSLQESLATIGVQAPLSVEVHRDEIYRRIQLQKQGALHRGRN